MLRGPHGRLRAKPQPAQPPLLGTLDDGEQQFPPHALSLRLRGNGERTDVRLRVILREFAGRVERLERDRPEDVAVRVVNGDEHGAVTAEPEFPQRLGVVVPFGQQPKCPVRRNPQFAYRSPLIWQCIPNHHVMHAIKLAFRLIAMLIWLFDRRPSPRRHKPRRPAGPSSINLGERESDGVQGQADARADHRPVDADELQVAPEQQLKLG
ncbi:MAG: hypothetical protein QOH87_2217 [Trebonia sp.]|nr:hypothetical protein [Trebonia sp.]